MYFLCPWKLDEFNCESYVINRKNTARKEEYLISLCINMDMFLDMSVFIVADSAGNYSFYKRNLMFLVFTHTSRLVHDQIVLLLIITTESELGTKLGSCQ